MKSEKSIEKKLKKHYKKTERTADLPPHKNVTVGGQTVSLYAPRRNIFVSAAAFAIYAVGLVSMVTLFILAGGKSGLFQPVETDDRGAAGSVSDTVKTPKTDSPVTSAVYEEIKLGEQPEFVDEVEPDSNIDREEISLKNYQTRLSDNSMIAVVTLLDMELYDLNSSNIFDGYGYFHFMIEKVLASGNACTLQEGQIYLGNSGVRWQQKGNGIYRVRHYCFEIPLTDIGGQYVVRISDEGDQFFDAVDLEALTSNLNGRHKNLDWEKYSDDAVQCEADCISAYREQIEEVLTYLPTTDGVEEFMAALLDGESEQVKKMFDGAECYNITPGAIREEIGGEIFKFTENRSIRVYSNQAYLVLNGEIYELTTRSYMYGDSLTSAALCDFDGDGNKDILYTCARSDLLEGGSSETAIYVFNTVSKTKTEIFRSNTAPKAVQRTLVVTEGSPADGKHFDVRFLKYSVEGATTFVASSAVCGSVVAENGVPKVTIDSKYDDPPVPDPTYGEPYHPYKEADIDIFKNNRSNLMDKFFDTWNEEMSVRTYYFYVDSWSVWDEPEEQHKLFDGDASTKWCLGGSDARRNAVVWNMTKPVYVNGYTFTTANDNTDYPERNPLRWRLYGAYELPSVRMNEIADNSTGESYLDLGIVPEGWVLIDAVNAADPNNPASSLLPDENYREVAFEAEHPGTYQYFMLLIDDVEGNVFQMGEFELYGFEVEPEPIPEMPELEPPIRDFYYDAYYGSYEGKDVFLHAGDLTAIRCFEVAGRRFIFGSSFGITVYYDGGTCSLQEAYKNGLLTREQVSEIADRHAAYVRDTFGQKYYDFLYGSDWSHLGPDTKTDPDPDPDPEPGSALDLETAMKIISENDDIETILEIFKRYQEPDYVGGINVTIVEFWLDGRDDNKIMVVVEDEVIFWYEYDHFFNEDGYMVLFSDEKWVFNPHYPEVQPLTDEKKQEIEDAWMAAKGEAGRWSYRYLKYYGTYNDYIVLFNPGRTDDKKVEMNLAGSKFKNNEPFEILVYFGGEFIDLAGAYKSGLLTAEHVAAIAEYHIAALKDFHGMFYYEIFEKDW